MVIPIRGLSRFFGSWVTRFRVEVEDGRDDQPSQDGGWPSPWLLIGDFVADLLGNLLAEALMSVLILVDVLDVVLKDQQVGTL
jgi:hypothetical protein